MARCRHPAGWAGGENLPAHMACAGAASPPVVPFVEHDHPELSEADPDELVRRMPGHLAMVAHRPGPPLIRQAAGAAIARLSGSMAPGASGHLDGVGHYGWARLGRGSVPETPVMDMTMSHGRTPAGPGRLGGPG
jgi:hypothetical protein